MIKKISLALALNLALFSGSAVAISGDNMDFGIEPMLSVENYTSGTASTSTGDAVGVLNKGTLLASGYGATGGTISNSLTYGIGAKFAYYNGVAVVADAAYRMGTGIAGTVSATNYKTVAYTAGVVLSADAPLTANSFSNLKGKIGVGYGFEVSPGSFIAPFAGVSYKYKSQTGMTTALIATTSPQTGTTAALPAFAETNTLLGIPVGVHVKVKANDDFGFEGEAVWHLLWSATTVTPRGDIATGIYAIGTLGAGSYSATLPAGSALTAASTYTNSTGTLASNYSLEFSGSVLWFMGSDFGLESIGLGFYYDSDTVAATPANTAITAPTATYTINAATNSAGAVTNGTLKTLAAISAYEAGLKLSFNF